MSLIHVGFECKCHSSIYLQGEWTDMELIYALGARSIGTCFPRKPQNARVCLACRNKHGSVQMRLVEDQWRRRSQLLFSNMKRWLRITSIGFRVVFWDSIQRRQQARALFREFTK